MSTTDLKSKVLAIWNEFKTRQWTWVVAALLCGFMAFYFDTGSTKVANADPADAMDAPATLIPAGYVLVPIEVANFESLDSILGKFGIVDLYISSDDPKKRAHKVGEKLKILRAPLNPSRFAVLVRDEDSSKLVSYSGAFTVVVQNPDKVGTGIVNTDGEVASGTANVNSMTAPKRHSRITVEVLNANEN
jgi:hypothetical protein